jgi:hypothetical protein
VFRETSRAQICLLPAIKINTLDPKEKKEAVLFDVK